MITSPDFIVVIVADEFKGKTPTLNKLWQIDFTYLKAIDLGWTRQLYRQSRALPNARRGQMRT